MSQFLGPIHFWLYGKIGRQEELTQTIAQAAMTAGWISDVGAFTKELPPLETVIDEGNIHGWLQGQIQDAEERYARLVLAVLTPDAARMEALSRTAYAFGKAHALAPDTDPKTAYRAFEDFFVNGMPCDHVNAVTEDSPTSLSWEMTQDTHAPYWSVWAEGSTPYYSLRKRVMDGMAEPGGLRVTMSDNFHYTVARAQG